MGRFAWSIDAPHVGGRWRRGTLRRPMAPACSGRGSRRKHGSGPTDSKCWSPRVSTERTRRMRRACGAGPVTRFCSESRPKTSKWDEVGRQGEPGLLIVRAGLTGGRQCAAREDFRDWRSVMYRGRGTPSSQLRSQCNLVALGVHRGRRAADRVRPALRVRRPGVSPRTSGASQHSSAASLAAPPERAGRRPRRRRCCRSGIRGRTAQASGRYLAIAVEPFDGVNVVGKWGLSTADRSSHGGSMTIPRAPAPVGAKPW